MPSRSVLALAFCLAACTPLLPGGTGRAPETGIAGAFSAQRIVADRGHDVMVGQVFVLRQADRVALTAEVGQAYHSGQVRLRMFEAWDDGQELPFRRAMRSERLCIGLSLCQGFRTGTFGFTRDAFEAAMRDGFEATLIGPDAVVTVRYPAAMFSEAREHARRLGIWP